MATVEAEIVKSSGTVVPGVVVNVNTSHEGYFRPPLDTTFHQGEELRLQFNDSAEGSGVPPFLLVAVQCVEKGDSGGVAGSVVRFTPRLGR